MKRPNSRPARAAPSAGGLKMLVLDVGMCHTGWAVVAIDDGSLVACGHIDTEKSSKKAAIRAADDTVRRCQELTRELLSIVYCHGVCCMAAELPGGGGKSSSAVKSMAIATALVAAVAEFTELPAEWVSPQQNKKGATGRNNASKDEMMDAAGKLYPQLVIEYRHQAGRYAGQWKGEFEDVADAICVWQSVRDGQLARTYRRRPGTLQVPISKE